MIGAGLAWLLLESRALQPYERQIAERGRRAFESLGQTGESLRQGISSVGDYARGGAKAVRDAFYEGAGTVAQRAQRGYETTRETIGQTWESHPLVVCAALLTAGIAAAILLPSTSQENRWMGQTAGAITRTARKKGRQFLKQGKQLASKAADVVGREARRQGITPGEIAGKVKRVADKARQAVTEQVG
jgi:hypothetical protein